MIDDGNLIVVKADTNMRPSACCRAKPARYTRRTLNFRHISIEGPIGVGKSALAEHLSGRLDAALVLEERENPFLADFYAERPGAALQAQLFYLLARHRQQGVLRQADLFSQLTIADYLFDRDKIYAYLNLDDNELFIYQRLFELLARDVSPPDLVIYLQAPTDAVAQAAARTGARHRGRRHAHSGCDLPAGAQRGLPALLLPLHGEPAAGRGDLELRQPARPTRSSTT